MLLILIATMATSGFAQQSADEPPCKAGVILVSKTVEPPTEPGNSSRLPVDKADSKSPAVLMPGCKNEPRKKRDYPLA